MTFFPYHQCITKDHIDAVEGLVGKVQRFGLAVEVSLRCLRPHIEETCLK